MRFLLSEGSVDPNTTLNEFVLTPIELACKRGHFEVCKLLLEDKRTIVRDNCWSVSIALVEASCYRDRIEDRVKIVRLLLSDRRVTVSHPVLYYCSSGVLARELLGDKRVDPAGSNNQPLEQAIRRRMEEVVAVLLEYPSVVANISERIKQLALECANEQIQKLILHRD